MFVPIHPARIVRRIIAEIKNLDRRGCSSFLRGSSLRISPMLGVAGQMKTELPKALADLHGAG